jgi:hypothetical protein
MASPTKSTKTKRANKEAKLAKNRSKKTRKLVAKQKQAGAISLK